MAKTPRLGAPTTPGLQGAPSLLLTDCRDLPNLRNPRPRSSPTSLMIFCFSCITPVARRPTPAPPADRSRRGGPTAHARAAYRCCPESPDRDQPRWPLRHQPLERRNGVRFELPGELRHRCIGPSRRSAAYIARNRGSRIISAQPAAPRLRSDRAIDTQRTSSRSADDPDSRSGAGRSASGGGSGVASASDVGGVPGPDHAAPCPSAAVRRKLPVSDLTQQQCFGDARGLARPRHVQITQDGVRRGSNRGSSRSIARRL